MNTLILKELREYLSDKNCELIAVTKTHPAETVQEAYQAGLRNFGENKAQEMMQKFEALPKDIKWHMIGHLQRNKVKYIAPFVSLIHSIDSFSLLDEVNKQAIKYNRSIDCLMQIHISDEETKFGMDHNELQTLFKEIQNNNLENVKIVGLMGMASNTNDLTKVRNEFNRLKTLYEQIKMERPEIKILSMGMSGDYKIAVEEGSTMIRVGSVLFGNRSYNLA